MRSRHLLFLGLLGAAGLVAACNNGDDDGSSDAGDSGVVGDGGVSGTDATLSDGSTDAALAIPARCNGTTSSPNTPPASDPAPAPALIVPAGLTLAAIGTLPAGARELVMLPNGDLLVGTNSTSVYLIANADSSGSDTPSAPTIFATFPDSDSQSVAQGISYDPTTCTIYVATEHDIYSVPYVDGLQTATPGAPIATLRPVAPDAGHDDDIHRTTSLVAVPNGQLYAGVGSDCNACVEVDPTRATIQQMGLDGGDLSTRATRARNVIGLAVNPATGTVWAGGAGQDDLPQGHPYEWFDAVTAHAGTADYGWPDCEENHTAYIDGAVCTGVVAPIVELPAYSTIIGAAFYPTSAVGVYDLGAAYHGGAFVTAHGSWHSVPNGPQFAAPPHVVFVPMNGDAPATAVDWSDPTKQWTDFVTGFQLADNITRVGRPTGIAVGPLGSLFVADDQTSQIYRIRHYLK